MSIRTGWCSRLRDFNVTLKVPTNVGSPYNDTSELDTHLGGVIWMANDGGLWRSEDGGQTWIPARGLHTVDAVNLAGLAKPDREPALYMGTVDNDSFFTRDGGANWRDCAMHLGDADAWFADIAQPGPGHPVHAAGHGPLPLDRGLSERGRLRLQARRLPTPDSAPPDMGPHNVVSNFVAAGLSPADAHARDRGSRSPTAISSLSWRSPTLASCSSGHAS